MEAEVIVAEGYYRIKAELEKFKEFAATVANQVPEKPDRWCSCGQCERNIDAARELLGEVI